jgi:glycine/D-amino acid oxidase-like deaminating enzyme
MKNESYWIDVTPIKSFPALRSDLEVDVLIVGGGITGITTAYLLQEAGVRVALIERERLASIDTGHTTAHLTCVTDTPLETLVTNFGRDHAQAVWDAGAAAIDEIERIVRAEQIECGFSRVPGYLHAAMFEKESDTNLRQDAELAQQLGFDAVYLDAVPCFNVSGIRFPDQAEFHPRKYLGRLAEIISENGSGVFEQSATEEFDAEKRRARVNGHWIAFDRVVMATNNPLVGLANIAGATFFQSKLSLYSS